MNNAEQTPLEILLFDMDGVLLTPAGYHMALQETVRRVGRALGFSNVEVTPAAIAQFEAAGATSEWDSSAICTALLLIRLWDAFEGVQFYPELLQQPHPPHSLPVPDFLAFAQEMAEAGPAHISPLKRAESILINHNRPRAAWQAAHLRETLRGAREAERSITHRIFQELVLGSEKYAKIYNRTPTLNQSGFLVTHDQPALSPEAHQALQNWLAKPNQGAAIFTNRPTREPDGRAGTPEGELGQITTGLQDLPLIGWGQLTWLSRMRGLEDEAFGKPAPAHALAALQCAAGAPVEAALQAGADLQLGKNATGWEVFGGARILAFEDGAAGLVSARAAVALLETIGFATEIHLFGISREPVKKAALAEVGGKKFVAGGHATPTHHTLIKNHGKIPDARKDVLHIGRDGRVD